MIKNVLFDLDGTLLPMDQDVFVRTYFKGMAKKLAPYGYEPEPLVAAIWAGTAAMVKNDGSRLNEEAFWDKFSAILGDKVWEHKPVMDEFYHVEFQSVKDVCGYDPEAKRAVDKIKAAGYRVALATNPIFPAVATESRIRWAGFEPSYFELYTTYENSRSCKPNPAYFIEVANKLSIDPAECLMVGNDATEDTAAEKAGMQVFLLTDCLINKENRDISAYPHGGFDDLVKFILG